MPYINPDKRPDLDKIVNQIPKSLPYGELNYLITRILMKQYASYDYLEIMDILGTLEAVKLEFYRRVAVPYETAKCLGNGDVY